MNETAAAELPRAPRPPGVVRRWLAAHPWAVDVFIAVSYLLGSGLMLAVEVGDPFSDAGDHPTLRLLTGLFLSVATVVTFLALLFRRRWPFAGFVAVAVICALHSGDSAQMIADYTALMFMMYAVPVFASVRAGWIAFGVGSALSAATTILSRGIFGISVFGGDTIGEVVLLLLVLLIGINIGNRRRYVAALVDRAEMLERDRDQLARIAVAEERERIAREMHDIVAHSLSVMVALSEGSARTVQSAPEKAVDAMQRSAETGRTALSEMRRLLGVLKVGAPTGQTDGSQLEFAPQPGLDNLQVMIEDFRRAGLEIHVETVGAAPADSGFGLAIYRIVQESLTNALRYAGSGAVVDVRLEYLEQETVITVRDHGRVSTSPSTMDNLGSGNGLTGLAERARMFGGEIRAGAHPDGGWIVIARLQMNGTI